jgi:hypothetical protein
VLQLLNEGLGPTTLTVA